jgi:leucyl-tRNA synthetase
MPQWAGSSWYYLRYMDPKNNKKLVDLKKEKYWNQVDFYVGGAEHATRHLIYARFWHKFLYDIGVVNTKEPFKKLQSVGLILAQDGRKMSKRFGNVVNPDEIVKTWGADTLRLYEMFMGPFADAIAWNTDNMVGLRRFLERGWRMQFKVEKRKAQENQKLATSDLRLETLIHKTIKKVTEDIEDMKFNTAVSSLMICLNELESASAQGSGVTRSDFESFLKLLAPFAPHMTEELWQSVSWRSGKKGSIHQSEWPKFDENKIVGEQAVIAVQVNGKVRGEIQGTAGASQEEVQNMALNKDEIKKWLAGKQIKKVIFVPNRILNFVVIE